MLLNMVTRNKKLLRGLTLASLISGLWLIWNAASKTESLPSLPKRPKLVVVLVIDQFRYDYLMRFRPYFVKGGFNRLLEGGAVFGDCRYNYTSTMTGPGHATLLTGAYPNVHGIIENDWYDRQARREVYCVEDLKTRLVENHLKASATPGYSPHNLSVSTLGDELRMADDFRSKVISISLKDRAAVLMGGHDPSAAYWYNQGSGRFVSSTYYMPVLPEWADEFNQKSPLRQFCGQKWQALADTPGANNKIFTEFNPSSGEPCPDPKFLDWLDETPLMNEAELAFATAAVQNEKLGQGPETDLLAVSLSVNDYIGHRYGPYSAEVADTILRTDRDLAKFFDELDKQVGMDNVWIAFSADHGVAPTPDYIQAHKLGQGMAQPASVRAAVEASLTKAFGPGPWIDDQDESYLYLNQEKLERQNIAESQAEEVAAKAAMSMPDVAAAFTRTQFMTGTLPLDPIARKAANSFNAKLGGDVFIVFSPYAVPTSYPTGTTHGTPWSYDTQVPLILWGTAFNGGFYASPCEPTDLAATLAALLGLTQPSGAQGIPLTLSFKAR
jgi:predicted AlkP superfamily pyrophosphatase or phosphodiesterase